MQQCVEEMVYDGSGQIILVEFEAELEGERLDVSVARMPVSLRDYGRSDTISIEEFISGCYNPQWGPRGQRCPERCRRAGCGRLPGGHKRVRRSRQHQQVSRRVRARRRHAISGCGKRLQLQQGAGWGLLQGGPRRVLEGQQHQQASHRLRAIQSPAIGQVVFAYRAAGTRWKSFASRQLSKHLREESCPRGPDDRRGREVSGRGAGDFGGRQPGCWLRNQWRPGPHACLLVGWGRIWVVKRQGLRLSSVGRLPLGTPPAAQRCNWVRPPAFQRLLFSNNLGAVVPARAAGCQPAGGLQRPRWGLPPVYCSGQSCLPGLPVVSPPVACSVRAGARRWGYARFYNTGAVVSARAAGGQSAGGLQRSRWCSPPAGFS